MDGGWAQCRRGGDTRKSWHSMELGAELAQHGAGLGEKLAQCGAELGAELAWHTLAAGNIAHLEGSAC